MTTDPSNEGPLSPADADALATIRDHRSVVDTAAAKAVDRAAGLTAPEMAGAVWAVKMADAHEQLGKAPEALHTLAAALTNTLDLAPEDDYDEARHTLVQRALRNCARVADQYPVPELGTLERIDDVWLERYDEAAAKARTYTTQALEALHAGSSVVDEMLNGDDPHPDLADLDADELNEALQNAQAAAMAGVAPIVDSLLAAAQVEARLAQGAGAAASTTIVDLGPEL